MTATLLITNFSRSIIQTYSQIHTSTHINIRFDQNVIKAESLKKDRKKVTKNHGWKLRFFFPSKDFNFIEQFNTVNNFIHQQQQILGWIKY